MSEKKIALVTGANKGIGKETARQLAQQGVKVLVGSRDSGRGEAAATELASEGLDVHALTLDVSNQASIDAAAAEVTNKFGSLDILVNNAGINLGGHGTDTVDTAREVWDETLETNVFGVLNVTKAFLPLLRKSPAGRIVNLSSVLASSTYHSTPGSPVYDFKIPAYNISKTMLNAVTTHIAYDLKDTKIKVNAAHPGWVKTEMGGEGATMELADGAKTSVALALLDEDGPTGAYIHLGESIPW